MGALYPYSLIPVLSVSTLLFFTAVRRGTHGRGLALYCLAIAIWSSTLIMIWVPDLTFVGERGAAVGAFIAATYLHAAYDATRQPSYRLVYVAYAAATVLTLAGMLRPGLLYGARAMARGPLFWPGMAMAITAATIPLVALAAAYRGADANDRPPLIGLFVAGVLSYGGGLSNAVLLSTGIISPLPMLTVLASLFLTAHVIRTLEPQDERRVLERSLLYAAVAAFLSAGFLFGVMQLVSISPPAGIGQYRLGAFFLLCMAAMAFEPLRQHLLEVLARRFVPNRAPAVALARALAQQETRADQVERLAELGALASAVAHEIRNPLGVMTVLLKRLEKSGPPSAIEAMREQIDRASHFADDLLAYGRPRPLELRRVDLAATAQLAATTAQQGHRGSTEHVSIEVEGEAVVEADQHQILQTLVVLIDNALLALADRQSGRIALDIVASSAGATVDLTDDGPGVPTALTNTLFEPFVTGRPRSGPHPGTGLGLAIARRIVERHYGRLEYRPAATGAHFSMWLPVRQPMLAPNPPSDAKPGTRDQT